MRLWTRVTRRAPPAWLQRLAAAVARRAFARNVAILVGGSTLSQAVSVLSTPVVTRLYTPADYGAVAALASLVSLFGSMASLRYCGAIPISEDDESAVQLLALSLAIVAVSTIAIAAAGLLLGGSLAAWAHASAARPYLWYVPLSFLGVSCSEVFRSWAIRKRAFGRIARADLQENVAGVLTKVVLGLGRIGPVGLLLGNFVGSTGGIGVLAQPLWQQDRVTLSRISLRGMRRSARRHWRFPVISTWISLLQSLAVDLPTLLLASFYGSGMVGAFALAQRTVGLPLTLLGTPVGTVYFAEAARLSNKPRQLLSLCLRTGKPLLLLGLGPLAAFVLAAPPLFTAVFGETWREAGSYAQLLAVAGFVQFAVSPISSNFSVLERQDLLLGREIGRTVLIVGAMYLARVLGYTPIQVVAVYTATTILASLSLFALSLYAIMQQIKKVEARRASEPAEVVAAD